ncbi:Patatin [Paraburkholderia piptadeniae]|uniref:Patatin n=1 Tax=Paraburkholderia piptadeniae TaxID=1701573 RepID=A0A1N7SAL3_9BURK|nr:patatin-like phospholipase family protein [Paraburkholderia piptadeniae]SIT44424.1 Patatin [Paraburkholderia piptadeniae]
MRSDTKKISARPDAFVLPRYDEIALVLQGGGALGSYQAGVVEGLAEANVEPDWIAGVSIGALNTAIIAGNAPENRVEALRGFWNAICHPLDWIGSVSAWTLPGLGLQDLSRKWASMWAAGRALTEGQPGFFAPRFPLPVAGLAKLDPSRVSYYDTAALKATLQQYADFDRINDGKIRVSVGAVNVRTGNLTYFDNARMRLAPEHFMASGALPPGFPAVEIDGEYYWDGGLVSNTPLTEVLRDSDHKDTLVFQVDLWSAKGNAPGDFLDISERAKDIQYSSRTRAITNMLAERQKHARFIKELLEHVPTSVLKADPLFRLAEAAADGSAINVVHLIYKNKPYEGHYKDYEFSMDTMLEHWQSGLDDIRDSFSHREWFDVPSREQGFATHDVHRPVGSVPQSDKNTVETLPDKSRKEAA